MSALAVRLTAALVALAATGAQAGGPLSICNDAAKTPIAYSSATVNLNYDLGPLGSRTNAQANTIVTDAVARWTDVGTATITIGRGTDLPVDVTTANYLTYIGGGTYSDGLNPVVYDNDGLIIDTIFGVGARNSVLGFAGSAYFLAPTCRFAEGRAVINGFISVSETTMIVVLAHEIGHLIGMDHTQLDNTQGLATANYPLMYPIAYRSSVTPLHEDDIAAVSALYPDATLNSVYGQISGTFVLADGVTPVLGANLWATETTTGKLYSIVSDYRTQGTGHFSLHLPAGSYNLRAEAIQTQFNGGSSVGPYSEDSTGPTTGASFLPPLYISGVPMATVTLGGGTPTSFLITAGCAATLTFRISGAGTVGGNCVITVPGAPTVNSVSFGPGNATVNFTAPASNGGSVITGYTATCSASGQITRTNSDTASPIPVGGLTGGVLYSCTVTAQNSIGSSTPSTPVTVTPLAAIDIVPILMMLLFD